MFDLVRLKYGSTDYVVHDPDDPKQPWESKVDGSRVVLTLVGTDSPQFQAQQRINRERAAARKAEGREPTQDEKDGDFWDLLAACTLGWTGVAFDGEPAELTRDNARALYAGHAWVREQVDAFVVKRGNFIKG